MNSDALGRSSDAAGYFEGMEKEEDKPERHLHLFGKMQKQVDRLDAMIKDIVASGKATQQKNPFHPIRTGVGDSLGGL